MLNIAPEQTTNKILFLFIKTKPNFVSYLYQLHEVLKIALIINSELAVVVDDVVVLHLAITAHAQGVVAGEVGALSH